MFARNASFLFGVALIAANVTPVHADEWNKKTTITINEPVQLPSCCNADHMVVLQPGTYVLALVDSLSDRHIVRVLAQDQKTVITTILAVPNYRLRPTGTTAFQFWETPAGQPRAMRAWFYPGDNFGQEFVYHKTKSVEIAKVALTPVPTVAVNVQTEAELKTVPVVVVDEKGEEAPMAAPVVVAEVAPPAAEPPAAAPVAETPVTETPAPATLPDTASPYPLFGLIGLGSVMVSKVMSRFSKRA